MRDAGCGLVHGGEVTVDSDGHYVAGDDAALRACPRPCPNLRCLDPCSALDRGGTLFAPESANRQQYLLSPHLY